tara:strand:- start:3155 stop:3562 length:408 start_codon:yes stop_codon:yes gene_type:complete
MIGTEAFDQFVSENRWAVITTIRKSGQPSSSVVAYARDNDTLVVSTTAPTLKVRTLENDPRVTITVFNDAAPFNFVTIEGHVEIERENLESATHLVFENIQGSGFSEPEDLPTWLKTQQRVILRIHAKRVSGVIR